MTSIRINEAVTKSADDYLLQPDESYTLQFQKMVVTTSGNKYVRSAFDIGHKQFLEIVEKYGLKPAKKWQVWDKDQKKNIPYNGEVV